MCILDFEQSKFLVIGICEQTDGMATASRLAPVFANIFMEWFKEKRLKTLMKKI